MARLGGASFAAFMGVALVAMAAAVSSGCGKSKPVKAAPATPSVAAEKKPAPTVKPAPDKKDGRAKLADAYHDIRWMLTGARRPDAATYTKHGFAGAAAFSKAFSDAATADADWASTTIAASTKRGCKQAARAGK